MGDNMAERLKRGGHTVIGYDKKPGIGVESLGELVYQLQTPRIIWVMIPAGKPTDEVIRELAELLEPGDIVVNGGNSRYTDDIRYGEELNAKGVDFVDAGVSGGVWGLQLGYALMVGGNEKDVQRLMPIFQTLKPEGDYGFVYAGQVGAGHLVKMVHNGIEYGMMQAFAEGWELLEASELVADTPGVFRSWQEGTVIRSWLLELLNNALYTDPHLDRLKGFAQDSGEGRWTVQAAVDLSVPLPVITAALFARFASRQEDSPAAKVVAALREQFGGHAVETARTGKNG
jgi:6-phosphogluconate dehydrogenase